MYIVLLTESEEMRGCRDCNEGEETENRPGTADATGIHCRRICRRSFGLLPSCVDVIFTSSRLECRWIGEDSWRCFIFLVFFFLHFRGSFRVQDVMAGATCTCEVLPRCRSGYSDSKQKPLSTSEVRGETANHNGHDRTSTRTFRTHLGHSNYSAKNGSICTVYKQHRGLDED